MKCKRFVASVLVTALLSGQAFAQAPTSGAPAPQSTAPAEEAPRPPPPALSDSLTGEAKSALESGKLLYNDGDYAGALLKFTRAHELSKDPRLLWNMAAAEKNLRHYARLEKLLDQYLQAGGASLSASDRSDAQALKDAVSAFVAEVTLKVNEAGATVFVDDVEVGTTPLAAPVRVDMGLRKFRVAKTDFDDFALSRELGGGTKTSLEVVLKAQVHEGRLRVSADPGASIRVDGKVVGLGDWEGRLASGSHNVEVTANGKQPWHSSSAVQDKQLTTVFVSLQATEKSQTGGVPKWLWAVGGTVLAAGLGTGAYFLFKPGAKGPPAAVDGSLGTVELPFRR